MIKFKNVEKTFKGEHKVLHNINLEFEEGGINVLIGPSGCGKTTTMKLINRLITQTSGSIFIDGKDISTLNPIDLRRQIGYVIQGIGLFPHMTIFENVSIIPKVLKWNKEVISERVKELLTLVNLDPNIYENRYPSELSGGQQQRVGVIRALATEPSIILMDEPFSALDPISRDELQWELKKLQKEIKKTIVFVTHDMDEALKIADKIIVMNEGRIVQEGSPEELLESPKNEFVRGFIGEKRINQAKDLPKVNKVMLKEFKQISSDSGVKEALNVMSSQLDEFIHVHDDKGVYMGKISFLKLKETKHEFISDIEFTKDGTVLLEDHLSIVLSKMEKYKTDIAVLDNEQKQVGIITKDKLLSILHQYYNIKSGVNL